MRAFFFTLCAFGLVVGLIMVIPLEVFGGHVNDRPFGIILLIAFLMISGLGMTCLHRSK